MGNLNRIIENANWKFQGRTHQSQTDCKEKTLRRKGKDGFVVIRPFGLEWHETPKKQVSVVAEFKEEDKNGDLILSCHKKF